MFMDVPGIGRINVARTGPEDALPVVFLHGVGLDLTWWGAQFEAFGHEREVVAFDLPGHGLSDDLGRAPTFDDMACALEGVIEALGGRPAHVVGLSVGGMIAQSFALRRPDLVQSLCLVATWCTFPGEVRTALRERARVARDEGMARIADLSNQRWFTADFRARRPDILTRTTRSLLQQSPEFHAGMWEMISGLEFAARLPAISCPTLVIAGELDINAPVHAAERIVEAIPSSRLATMPGLGHFPPLEAADEFNRILSAFLASIESEAVSAESRSGAVHQDTRRQGA